MPRAPYLGEVGTSLAFLLLLMGFALAAGPLLKRDNRAGRVIMFGVAAILVIRYVVWRATETLAPAGLTLDAAASWSFFAIEASALLGSLSSFLIFSRIKERSGEATDNRGWWGEHPPKVAILIATYNEEREILERTIIGARALRHPDKEVLVLDDGRRDWLRDLSAELGVRYLRRPDNKGSKAGNLNHALDVLARDPVPPGFVAVLDADFVPRHGFISRSLALFHDPAVGLVQTPQHFFNADPIQHNLRIETAYPDEQRLFFDHLQPSRDAWDIAFCCGTSSLIRWQALREIGGFPTESITEDFMLTLALMDARWRTVYLNEPLTEGLAPEGLKEYVTQRARWCLGLMQIARSRLGPLGRSNLRIRDRWSVVDSVLYWTTTFLFRLASFVYPLLYWFFNVTVLNASVADVITYFGAYYLWVVIVLNIVSRGAVVPVLNDVSQLLGAIPTTRAAFVGLWRPQGHKFTVTAKGGDRSKITIQWSLMRPFLILLALTILGLTIGIISDGFAFYDAGEGKKVVLFWTLYNLLVLVTTILACFELPRRERHIADRPEPGMLRINGDSVPVWVVELSQSSASLRGPIPAEARSATLEVRGVGAVPCRLASQSRDQFRFALSPSAEQTTALILRLHAEDGGAPGTGGAQLPALLGGMLKHLHGIAKARWI